MRIDKIADLMEATEAHLTLLLCHHNADPDAICAAYALSHLLKRMRPSLEVEIAAATGLSKLSKRVIEFVPIKTVKYPRFDEADINFLVDTSTVEQLEDWKRRVMDSKKPLVLIDHHTPHPETEHLVSLSLADESAPSTCEVVYGLLREAGVDVARDVALALFLGMAYDTKHFTLANSRTFKVAAELADAGVDVEEAMSILTLPMESSERVARIKAGNRLRLVRVGEWFVVFSNVSSYQASAARALVSLGAHVAVVGGEKGDRLRLSLRAQREFHMMTGIHLGRDVANPLGTFLHGMGGGHSTSAGVNGRGDLDEALAESVRLIRRRLETQS